MGLDYVLPDELLPHSGSSLSPSEKNLNDKLQHYFISTMSHTISMVLQTHKEAWTKYLW